MGDILPAKRQAIVERLQRRFEKYRRHQNACLPRYEHSISGICDQHRQEALLLRQRYIENKVKKSKRCENHQSLSKDFKQERAISNIFLSSKTNKRQAKGPGAPLQSDQNCEDHEHQVKISRNNRTADCQETTTIPSFSVQIVQQFTNSSNSCQTPHSQTIQTNVTVKAVTGNLKNSSSPLASATSSVSTNGADISVGTNIECKQEKEADYNINNRTNGTTDRFPDTFPTLGFPEDSADDVIHPDILKDLIDDVFTNPTDLMKDFNFEESASKDGEETDKNLECSGSVMEVGGKTNSSTTASQIHFPPTPPMISPFSGNQSASPLFDSSTPVMTTTPSTPPYPPNPRVQPYTHSSPLSMNSTLGLDFKLTEPSPAAQTLKQMAEQHQSMQQKQQQLGLGLGSPHSRSPFATDAFADPLSLPSMRSGFINGTSTHLNPLQKSPGSLYPPMAYVPQSDFSCIRTQPGTVMYKHESNDNLFPGMDGMGHIPDVGMHKRQQVLLLQRINSDGKQNLSFTTDHKPQYGGTRPLSHFTDSSVGSPISGQFTSGQRPPSGPSLQMSQAQQITQQNLQPLTPTGHTQPMTTTQQYHSYPQTPGSPPAANFQITMSQSQSLSFTSPFGCRTPSSSGMTNLQTPQHLENMTYLNRPPPDYKLQPLGDVNQHNISNYGNVGRSRATGNGSQIHRQVNNYRRSDGQVLSSDACPSGGYINKSLQEHVPRSDKLNYTNPLTKNPRSPNVNIGPDGLNISQRNPGSTTEWRPSLVHCPPRITSQSGPRVSYPQSYTNDMRGMSPPQSSEKMQRYPSNQVVMQQQQQLALQGNIPNASVNMQMSQSISMSSGIQIPNQIYPQGSSTPHDGSQINLDFFDNIESSATDLLNFDPVMQTSGASSNFTLLDEIGILGK
ncbi:neurogenic protein mastermind-like isoform X2 [Centruroides vittatus]|uniref:neurogenic protein mastermind-like isoform X2 n=1 Tax=Centruroides vittatus TaxID=120091 RepID=UPI00350FB0C2